MPEIPGVSSKVGADVSGYLQGMREAADVTKTLEERGRALVDSLGALGNATQKEKDQLLELWRASVDAAGGANQWTEANQRAAMAMSASHSAALKLNEAFDEGKRAHSEFAEEMLKAIGMGAAFAGGLELAAKAVEVLKEGLIGSIEGFVTFLTQMDRLHEKVGVPIESAAAWEQSAKATDVSATRIADSIAMMDQRLEEGQARAVEAVNELGISMKDLRDATPDQQVEMLTTAIAKFKEEGGKADVIVKELFGKAGLGMLNVLTEDAADLRDKIKEINGPLHDQVQEAKEYEKQAALLSAHWEKIRRSIAEPVVGGLAAMMGGVNEYGPVALVNPMYWQQGGDQSHGASGSWGGNYGFGPGQNPVEVYNAVASKADVERADAAAMAEQADFTRRLIELEKEYSTAVAGSTKGLEASIAKIQARSAAKVSSIEADQKLSNTEKAQLEDMVRLVADAEEASARSAAARKTDTDAHKEYAAAAKLSAAADASEATGLDSIIAKIDAKRDKEIDAATATITEAQAEDRLTDELLDAANAHIRAANAAHDSAVERARATDEAKRSAEATKDEIAVDQALQRSLQDLAVAHHQKGDAIDAATQRTIDHIEKLRDHIIKDKELTDEEKRLLLIKLDVAEATEREAGATKKHTEELKKLANTLNEVAHAVGSFQQFMNEMGVANEKFQRQMHGTQTAVKGAAEAVAGYYSGNYAMMAAGVFSFASGLHQIFVAPEYEKVMTEVGDQWGVMISAGLAKAIASTETHDHVSRAMAELLQLDRVMAEAGGDPSNFSTQIGDLLNAVALGAVPASEGVAALGKAFQALATSAAAGSFASEAAMIAMIKRARELGEDIPAITGYIKGLLGGLPDLLGAFFSGQGSSVAGRGFTSRRKEDLDRQLAAGEITQDEYKQQKQAYMSEDRSAGSWSPQQAKDNQQIFAASFQALAAAYGVVRAAQMLGDAFDVLVSKVPEGMPMSPSLEHFQMINDLIHNSPEFRGAADASQAGSEILRSLLDTGNLNQETTDAFARSTETLLQQSIDAAIQHGYSPDQARIAGEEANLPLLAQLQHAETLGAKLSPEAQEMLRKAQEDGVLPLKTVSEQSLEQLREINRNTAGGGYGNRGSGGGGGGGGQGNGGGGGGGNTGNNQGEEGTPLNQTGSEGFMSYDEGGPVASTGPAIVHAGEYVIPRDGNGPGPDTLVIHNYLYPGADVLDTTVMRRIQGGYIKVTR